MPKEPNHKKVSFADSVRNYVRTIPPGKTASYKDVAIAVGSPNSARAVAQVMAKNYDKEVPCHRVIKNNGDLGGYNRGGVGVKYKLLKEEGYNFVK